MMVQTTNLGPREKGKGVEKEGEKKEECSRTSRGGYGGGNGGKKRKRSKRNGKINDLLFLGGEREK